MTKEEIISEMQKLSREDRELVALAAVQLCEETSAEELLSQFELSGEQKAELDRRWEAYLADPSSAKSTEDFQAEIRRRWPRFDTR